MELSSMDIERKTFDNSRRGGFDRDQVTEYLLRVARVLAQLESDLSVSHRRADQFQRDLTAAPEEGRRGIGVVSFCCGHETAAA